MDKIQGYVGTLHGNLWERCTTTYGIVAREKHENTLNINVLSSTLDRLTCS